MNFNTYQTEAAKTVSENGFDLRNAALGLCGEAGEFADLVKKFTYQGHDLDKEHLKRELGDIMWYMALAATIIDCNLEDVAETNIAKLRARYPKGHFEAQNSKVRKEGAI